MYILDFHRHLSCSNFLYLYSNDKLTPDANGMYEVIFDDDVTVKVEYIATNYVNVKIEQTENAAVYINGTLTETEDTRVNLNENFIS